jgi:hypothetical protein
MSEHEDAAKRVNELVDQINTHRRAYYEGNTVLILSLIHI